MHGMYVKNFDNYQDARCVREKTVIIIKMHGMYVKNFDNYQDARYVREKR